MNKELTVKEQNVIKDLLKHIGSDDDFNAEMASAVGMTVEEFDSITEDIFQKLQNGRLIIEGN